MALVLSSQTPTKYVAALQGNYYSITAASGTAVVTSLTALTEASPALIIENTAAAGGKTILMDYLRLEATAIAAAGTDWQYAFKTDNLPGKWGSAGSAITPQNVMMGAANASVGTVHFGALVVPTATQSSSNARTLAGGYLTPVGTAPVQIIGDTVEFRFGPLENVISGVRSNVASNGAHTFAMMQTWGIGPCVISPGTTLTLFLWGTSEGSAPSYTLQGGWYEY